MTKNITSFKKGNLAQSSWTRESCLDMLERALRNIENKEVTTESLTDVWRSVGIFPSTAHHLRKRFNDLDYIFKDVEDLIKNVLHKGAIHKRYNVAAVIWRLKQMGEVDKIETENTNIEKKVTLTIGKRPSE